MSSADDHETQATKHRAKKKPTGDYQVRYCRPPVEHRFKLGSNANPKGRKKGSKNHKLVIQEVLFEPITVRGERDQASVVADARPRYAVAVTIRPLRDGSQGGHLLTAVLPKGKQMSGGRDRPLTLGYYLDLVSAADTAAAEGMQGTQLLDRAGHLRG